MSNSTRQREVPRSEVEAVARQLWLERGGKNGSPEEDWFRAEAIIRSRNGGNSSPATVSYLTGAETTRSETKAQSKERMDMEYNTPGNAEQTRSGTGIMDRVSQTAGDLSNRVSQTAGDLSQRAGEMMDRDAKTFPRSEHREGILARSIEQQTARLPSDVWLWAAVGSMGLSLAFELSGREKTANFVGHWAPTLLIFGLYNKMVKLQGSDGV